MPARLISLDYLFPQCDTRLTEFPVLIGRGPDARIRLDDASVSARHCEIDFFNGRMIVRDLDSLHGTFVNGSRIRESELTVGDHLAVGMLTFQVKSFQDTATDARPADRDQRRPRREESPALAAT